MGADARLSSPRSATTPQPRIMPGSRNALADSPHCLIVDDEPALRQLLVHLMSDAGFACIEAGDGEAALAAMERHEVSLVLSDLRMPKLDGLGLLTEIRRRWPDTAVILISGVADVKVAVSALASGAMDYLTKPVHVGEVRVRVAQAMEKRWLILENRHSQERLQEKVALHYQRTLRQIGIEVRVRVVDSAQFQRMLDAYDFDMLPVTWYNSLSPGNEQDFYYGSAGREIEGTRNYPGIADAAVDRLIKALLRATTREDARVGERHA